jgi:hypothetical protein
LVGVYADVFLALVGWCVCVCRYAQVPDEQKLIVRIKHALTALYEAETHIVLVI